MKYERLRIPTMKRERINLLIMEIVSRVSSPLTPVRTDSKGKFVVH